MANTKYAPSSEIFSGPCATCAWPSPLWKRRVSPWALLVEPLGTSFGPTVGIDCICLRVWGSHEFETPWHGCADPILQKCRNIESTFYQKITWNHFSEVSIMHTIMNTFLLRSPKAVSSLENHLPFRTTKHLRANQSCIPQSSVCTTTCTCRHCRFNANSMEFYAGVFVHPFALDSTFRPCSTPLIPF